MAKPINPKPQRLSDGLCRHPLPYPRHTKARIAPARRGKGNRMDTNRTILVDGLRRLNLPFAELRRIADLPPCPRCGKTSCPHPENQTTTAQMRSLLYAVLEAAGASPESMGILPETPERRTQ